ncbi:MAG TPA: hypothetical protein VIZ18_07150 [Ktedonobacteraceae bacterium]
MGIYLGQMPPAEMARLKAEIAETLIANFSYPRFFDYRTNTLRIRPVDRGKRQEIWTFLSSFDFNTFSRIDVTSPDFQRQVERLLIQFVQRNRAFFGQQGRKRMPDVRALITSSSTSVTEGLRGHLSGRATTPFGNARPVVSWSKSNNSGRLEPGWEQIANPTMSLQQQLQEARGEIRPGASSDARPAAPPPVANGAANNGAATTSPRRSPRLRATTQGNNNGNEGAAPAPAARPAGAIPSTRPIPPDEMRAVNPPSGPLAPPPSVAPAAASNPPAPPVAPVTEAMKPPVSSDQPVLRAGIVGDASAPSAKPDEKASPIQERDLSTQAADSSVPPAPAVAAKQPAVTQPQVSRQRELTRTEPLAPTLTGQQDSATLMVSDEDVVIFEEMRHQLLVWLRVEVVRVGVDLSGQTPAQLLEILGQQDGADETRLQVISTLLGLVNQVIAHGYATLVEYKQAMMFYLIHTRRAR